MENTPLTELLRSWPHEPGRLNTRLSKQKDGRDVVLVRVELGILQIELDGRPDGLKPGGADSMLDVGAARAAASTDSFSLDEGICTQLRDEAGLFSYRSMVRSALEDFEGVLHDTEHNIRISELIRRHAVSASDRSHAVETLPPLLMMRARVRSTMLVRAGEITHARAALDVGLREIEQVFLESGGHARFEASPEVRMLSEMRELLVPRLPSSQREEIRSRLEQALAVENFELAAILRNELRQMH